MYTKKFKSPFRKSFVGCSIDLFVLFIKFYKSSTKSSELNYQKLSPNNKSESFKNFIIYIYEY